MGVEILAIEFFDFSAVYYGLIKLLYCIIQCSLLRVRQPNTRHFRLVLRFKFNAT
jgi:hypothetical protein